MTFLNLMHGNPTSLFWMRHKESRTGKLKPPGKLKSLKANLPLFLRELPSKTALKNFTVLLNLWTPADLALRFNSLRIIVLLMRREKQPGTAIWIKFVKSSSLFYCEDRVTKYFTTCLKKLIPPSASNYQQLNKNCIQKPWSN